MIITNVTIDILMQVCIKNGHDIIKWHFTELYNLALLLEFVTYYVPFSNYTDSKYLFFAAV